jgi:hypothetical protein
MGRRVGGPRRDVVKHIWLCGTDDKPVLQKDVLECGHILNGRIDWRGEVHSERRLCWKCKGDRPADDPDAIQAEWYAKLWKWYYGN